MKERPILMSAPMVRATLRTHDPKTQTRRVVKGLAGLGRRLTEVTEFQPTDTPGYDFIMRDRNGLWNDFRLSELLKACPYGQPGEGLWVRETFLVQPEIWMGGHGPQPIHYAASTEDRRQVEDYVGKPSIHMPRWASRITLEVTEVRVERLQDISEEDAKAEGIIQAEGFDLWATKEGGRLYESPRLAFMALWDSINGQRPGMDWQSNPWVWAVSFKRITP